jgi:hypothetical protein
MGERHICLIGVRVSAHRIGQSVTSSCLTVMRRRLGASWSLVRSPALTQGDHLDYELLCAAFVAGFHGTLLGWSGRADGGAVAAIEDVDRADEGELHDSPSRSG